MAKRFTDTDKWKKQLLRSMPTEYKLLWIYICDDCNHAGIWHVDMDVASLRIGEALDHQRAIEVFKDKVVVFDNGFKWYIPDFIEFQYGELNEKNRVHESVIKELNKYDLLKNKGLISPLQGVKDKDKDKDKEEYKPPLKNNWNCKPNSDIHLPLPVSRVTSLIEQVFLTKQTMLLPDTVLRMFAVFKSQKLDGNTFYQSEQEIFKHFSNWLPNQKFSTFKNSEPAEPTDAERREKTRLQLEKYADRPKC